MLSNKLIAGLLLIYCVIMGTCIWEKNWARACYWLGASLIQVGILNMK